MLFAHLHIKNYKANNIFFEVLQNKHNMTISIANCGHQNCSTDILWIVDLVILMFSEVTEIEIHSRSKTSSLKQTE